MNYKSQWDELEEKGLVKFEVLPDESADYDNLAGDTFNPKVNTAKPQEYFDSLVNPS